tara:strand:+ start:407 stop:664 length:258 start_codon:yes stop_codon:yes gene_type:complete
MTNYKQLTEVKNLLMDAHDKAIGLNDVNLQTFLDMANVNFQNAVEKEEKRLRELGCDGVDLLLIKHHGMTPNKVKFPTEPIRWKK